MTKDGTWNLRLHGVAKRSECQPIKPSLSVFWRESERVNIIDIFKSFSLRKPGKNSDELAGR